MISQNQANNWYCGFNSGLNFNTTPPTVLSGQSSVSDNSSTISDANGQLLFYTDGSMVWNRNNVVMSNGSGLISSNTAGQCGLIVPIPSTNKYVVFSNTEFSSPGQLHYTVVDMSLSAGLGDVIPSQKNISLGTGWTEKMCAYYNSSCNYYWVLMHKWNNNQFVALKVDASGVTTTSVVSSIGSIHNCGTYSAAHDAMGQLTISKDGHKVVNALTCQDKFELFDFDINTGMLSNFIAIPGNGGNAWGTGFSSDSKKLYVNSIFGQNIFQYDLSTYTSSSIINSKTSLFNTGTGGYNFGYMELGPDNKMYIARPNTNYFSVINFPNNPGVSSGFVFNGINLSPKTSSWGISRIAYNIGTGTTTGTFSGASVSDNVTCKGLSNGSATITPTGAGTYNYLWSPGGYTTSVVNNLSAGVYTITINNGACSTATTAVTISEPPLLVSSITSYSVCEAAIVTLNPSITGGTPSYSVLWDSGANTVSISVNPSVTTVYNYTITDANSCIKTQSVQVNVESTIANFINLASSCNSSVSFTNTSTNSSTAFWDFGDGHSATSGTVASNNYGTSGVYTVSLISSTLNGCRDTIQKIVSVNASVMNLDYDYVIKEYKCLDSVFFVNKSSGAVSYSWSLGNGTTSGNQTTFSVFYTPGNYQISLIGSTINCKDSLTKNISVNGNSLNLNENMPNVFTPNGDGVNDIFDFKKIANCSDFTFDIFDRWGLLILSASDKKQSFWDGRTTSGEKVTDGTYFYIVNVDNGTKFKGTITLFR
ncbi:MAG: gliding motility-associated C-terminal domain-containing protein [Bacteroidetes bacterium]|nr:gliding motility-associated C-terminal domain-containing protein [Bacteroidota bacterium]